MENSFPYSLRAFRIFGNAVWPHQCPCIVPTPHEPQLPRYAVTRHTSPRSPPPNPFICQSFKVRVPPNLSRVPFVWEEPQQTSFEALKKSFTSVDLLRHYDPTKQLILETDASDYAIAGILSHEIDKKLEPVAFFSHKMLPAELNLKVPEKPFVSTPTTEAWSTL